MQWWMAVIPVATAATTLGVPRIISALGTFLNDRAVRKRLMSGVTDSSEREFLLEYARIQRDRTIAVCRMGRSAEVAPSGQPAVAGRRAAKKALPSGAPHEQATP